MTLYIKGVEIEKDINYNNPILKGVEVNHLDGIMERG